LSIASWQALGKTEGRGVEMRGGLAPSQKPPPPLLAKERGIKGVRLVSNF